MNGIRMERTARKYMWRKTNIRLFPSAVLCISGAILSSSYGKVRHGSIDHKFIAVIGVLFFVFFAITFLRVFTKTLARLIASHHLARGRAAAVQFVTRSVGYIVIFLTTLDLVGIPVGKLLLGGAALGIILGVAAQQALANLFASIVLIISQPFSVGQNVTIKSGGLGGQYIGEIKDIGLTHTRLQEENGNIVLLPNSALLSGATITMQKIEPETAKK